MLDVRVDEGRKREEGGFFAKVGCYFAGHVVPPEPGVKKLLSGVFTCVRCKRDVWRDHLGRDVFPVPRGIVKGGFEWKELDP